MFNSPELLIAWRYLFAKNKDASIAFMTKICFLGICIGTFALMLTLIITNGFEKTIHEKMQGINASIIISSPGNRLDYEQLRPAIEQECGDIISGISAGTIKQAIIEKNKNQTVVFLKGIDAAHEGLVTTLEEKIIAWQTNEDQKNKPLLKNLVTQNNILIGSKMAQELGIKIGEQVSLMIPESGNKRRILLKKKTVIIAGIFKIGLEEYDNNFAYASLDFVNKTFDDEGVDTITIKVKESSRSALSTAYQQQGLWAVSFWSTFGSHLKQRFLYALGGPSDEQVVIKKLQQSFSHLTISSWKDLYPALVSSLKLEKYAMFFILALITLVASMNMISLLFMQIQQKRRDIAILKAIGLERYRIRRIFLSLGMTITLLASLVGLGLAALGGYILENHVRIDLPDVYYVSYLPARMEPEIFIVVFLATLLLGFLATFIPAQQVQRIHIADVLRHE